MLVLCGDTEQPRCFKSRQEDSVFARSFQYDARTAHGFGRSGKLEDMLTASVTRKASQQGPYKEAGKNLMQFEGKGLPCLDILGESPRRKARAQTTLSHTSWEARRLR